MKIIVYAFTLLSLTALALPARADAGKPQKDAEKRAQIEARIKQVRSDILRKEVGLEPSKADAAEKILERHAVERKKLAAEQQARRQALATLLESDSNDQAAYAKAVKSLRAGHAKLVALRDREFDELGHLMTPKQQAKFLASVHHAQQKLGALLKEYRGEEDD